MWEGVRDPPDLRDPHDHGLLVVEAGGFAPPSEDVRPKAYYVA